MMVDDWFGGYTTEDVFFFLDVQNSLSESLLRSIVERQRFLKKCSNGDRTNNHWNPLFFWVRSGNQTWLSGNSAKKVEVLMGDFLASRV